MRARSRSKDPAASERHIDITVEWMSLSQTLYISQTTILPVLLLSLSHFYADCPPGIIHIWILQVFHSSLVTTVSAWWILYRTESAGDVNQRNLSAYYIILHIIHSFYGAIDLCVCATERARERGGLCGMCLDLDNEAWTTLTFVTSGRIS